MYQWLVYAHLGSVILFVLAHGPSAAMAFRVRQEGSPDGVKAVIALSTLSSRIMYPFFYLVLLTGIALGFAGSWWRHAWIWAALAVLVVTAGLMIALGREYHPLRLAAGLGRARGTTPAPTAAQLPQLARLTNPGPITALGLVAFAVLLWLMILKPF